jgi:hypothetical protein
MGMAGRHVCAAYCPRPSSTEDVGGGAGSRQGAFGALLAGTAAIAAIDEAIRLVRAPH